jgi:hypothetical protein
MQCVCGPAEGADSLSKCLRARDATDPLDNDDTVDTFWKIDRKSVVLYDCLIWVLPPLLSTRTGMLYPQQKSKKE